MERASDAVYALAKQILGESGSAVQDYDRTIMRAVERLTLSGLTSTADGTLSIGRGTLATVGLLRVSYLGDSIVNQALPTWPDYLATAYPYFATSTATVNYGISGERASLMVTNYATEAHVNRPTGSTDEGWFFLHAGGNDISDGVSAATVYGYLKSLWASARADGYTVIALTVLPRASWGSGSQGIVDTLNASIVGDPTLYDYLVRADLVLPTPSNTLWYYDTTHPTVLGSQLIAAAVAAVLP